MADVVSPEKRSQMMAGIRAKNTKPELFIRRHLHGLGFRFRLHDKRLPGSPDLVFPKHRAVILVHGCFWHGHQCSLFKWPRSRREFWSTKITGTMQRDARIRETLHDRGWRVAEVWECALRGRNRLAADRVLDTLSTWLSSTGRGISISEEGVCYE